MLVRRFNLKELAEPGSAIEAWVDKGGEQTIDESPNSIVHKSDLVRLLVLWKHGGIYIDTDVIVTGSFDSVQNTIGIEGELG